MSLYICEKSFVVNNVYRVERSYEYVYIEIVIECEEIFDEDVYVFVYGFFIYVLFFSLVYEIQGD